LSLFQEMLIMKRYLTLLAMCGL